MTDLSRIVRLDRFDHAICSRFDGRETVEYPGLVLFWRPPTPFGQWTPSVFEIDGVRYGCAEQFMMAEKARLFGDREAERRILATDDPDVQRRLGRAVEGFVAARWDAVRFDVVVKGNLAKFRSDPVLRELLAVTGRRRLAEASPMDRIWGIGLPASDPRSCDPEQWLGSNLLGRALEAVRDLLARDATPFGGGVGG